MKNKKKKNRLRNLLTSQLGLPKGVLNNRFRNHFKEGRRKYYRDKVCSYLRTIFNHVLLVQEYNIPFLLGIEWKKRYRHRSHSSISSPDIPLREQVPALSEGEFHVTFIYYLAYDISGHYSMEKKIAIQFLIVSIYNTTLLTINRWLY